jgi:hypothetical protein
MDNPKSLQEPFRLRAFLESMDEFINDEKHYQMLMQDIAAVDALIAHKTGGENMEIKTASQAADFLREQGILVSRSLARLTTVVMYERGQLCFYSTLNDEELVELARHLQRKHAAESRVSASAGVIADQCTPDASGAPDKEPARGQWPPAPEMKGGAE